MKKTQVFALLAAVLVAALPAAHAQESESTAIAELMLGVGEGLTEGVEHSIAEEGVGWAMTALGLDSDPTEAVVEALEQIEETLIEMENELANIEELLAQQSCQNAANVAAVQNALTAIDTWVGRGSAPINGSYLALVNDAKLGIDVTQEAAQLFDTTLHGNAQFGPLEELLAGLDNALLDQGNAEQLISACGLLIPPPDEEWDDRPYFQQLADLVGYYAEYQARALLLIVEAYHWNALQAWIAAGNDPSSLSPDNVADICNDATGDVFANCVKAENAYNFVRTNLRAQYGEAGAPYSSGTPQDEDATFDYDETDPVIQIHNTTGTVWVKDIDDFFKKGGYSTSCQASTSKAPCGPGVGVWNHATFEKYNSSQPVTYGYTTEWHPASAELWSELTGEWSGSGTTFASLMEDTHGFVGASTSRVYFSGDDDTSIHEVSKGHDNDTYYFEATRVACFVATPMTKGNSTQPFCSQGFGNIVHGTSDHANSANPCINAVNTPHGTLDDADIESPFFEFLYNMQSGTCASSSHPNGHTFYPGPPGWLLQYESFKFDSSSGKKTQDTGTLDISSSELHKQYHWPALVAAGIDGSPLSCIVEPGTGQLRNAYALNGRTNVPRLCGADFDRWFDKWIAPPATSEPTITTPAPVVVTVPEGSTSKLANHEVTATVTYTHLVSAVDREDGDVEVSCFPPSDEAFQLGTTEVECTATDSAGDTARAFFDVHVRYPFHFAGALDDHLTARTKAGRVVRVAFSLGGKRTLDESDTVVTSVEVDCASGAELGNAVAAADGSELRYRRGQRAYRFGWKTQKAWKRQCRDVVVSPPDGSSHRARVWFR